MISSHRRLASIAITACCAVPAAGALAAQASAAALAANKACYVNADPAQGAPMIVTGSGFEAGATVQLTGGTTFGNAVADANGNVSIPAQAPELATIAPASKTTTLTATADNADGTQTTATLPVQSANLAVATKPGSVRNVRKDKVTFTFSGFAPGKHIYGYYIRTKVVAKAKFAKAQGPCGMLKQKALLYPGGRPSKDKYKVTFESSSKFNKSAFPRVTGTLNILHF
ncbi:MAG TPA: hypothetical protein VHW96_03385 [Solirubrobacteraceae bacterium]|jgi:hypothetical protein|nr:hypothetical protein [Solirubrobacteraceae bacterium]